MQADRQDALRRLATIEGHLKGIRRMIEEDVYCVDILKQTNAVQRAIACQLERSGVSLAVLGPNGDGEPWNLSSVAGSGFLDQWLAQRAVSRMPFGPYVLVRLRPGLAPGDRCPSSGGGAPGSGSPAARGTSPPSAGSDAPGSAAS